MVTKAKIAFKSTTASWMCLDVPRHSLTCLDLTGRFGWSEDGMATIEVIENER